MLEGWALKMRSGTSLSCAQEPPPQYSQTAEGSCFLQGAHGTHGLTQGCYEGNEQNGIRCLACIATDTWLYLLKSIPIKINEALPGYLQRSQMGTFGSTACFLISPFCSSCNICNINASCSTVGLWYDGARKISVLSFQLRTTGQKAEAPCPAQTLWSSALYHTGVLPLAWQSSAGVIQSVLACQLKQSAAEGG